MLAYQWAVVGVSPFWGGVVVGGKGGAMMMVMRWGTVVPVYALRFLVVVAVHRTGSALPQIAGERLEWDCDGASAPPPQPQIPHITPVRTHGAEVEALASHRGVL